MLLFCHELSFIDWLSHRAFSNFHFTSAQPQLFINFFLCLFQDESGSLSSGESDIGVDDDEDELLDDDDMEDGRGEGRDDGSQANSLNDSDNDF